MEHYTTGVLNHEGNVQKRLGQKDLRPTEGSGLRARKAEGRRTLQDMPMLVKQTAKTWIDEQGKSLVCPRRSAIGSGRLSPAKIL